MVGITYSGPYIKILTSFVHYAATADSDKDWDEKWMTTMDDRQEDGTNPPFICLKPCYWDWRDVKLPSSLLDTWPIAVHYDHQQ